jgi:hypothetical protein
MAMPMTCRSHDASRRRLTMRAYVRRCHRRVRHRLLTSPRHTCHVVNLSSSRWRCWSRAQRHRRLTRICLKTVMLTEGVPRHDVTMDLHRSTCLLVPCTLQSTLPWFRCQRACRDRARGVGVHVGALDDTSCRMLNGPTGRCVRDL